MAGVKVPPSEKAERVQLPLDMESIQALIELLVKHGIREFSYRYGDLEIRIVQQGNVSDSESVPAWLAPLLQSLTQTRPIPEVSPEDSPSPPPESTPSTASVEVEQENLHYICAPIVGTFYRAPAPDAPPFVEVGSKVQKGQTVCIIEAMKIMNEIQSDVDGEVVAIYIANGTPVEYGERLIAIRPESTS